MVIVEEQYPHDEGNCNHRDVSQTGRQEGTHLFFLIYFYLKKPDEVKGEYKYELGPSWRDYLS